METESFFADRRRALTTRTSGASWTARAASHRGPKTHSSNEYFQCCFCVCGGTRVNVTGWPMSFSYHVPAND